MFITIEKSVQSFTRYLDHPTYTDILVVEQGGKGKLEGAYVSELMPLADNLNLLIENERRQRERYRR